ncbi:ATP-binding protein [Salmonirosea aquatica]|uniref:histidine kinase n=1 Tax=Salmonirosea aquatica TaxID=2654236 RepID=A0A7C9FMU3_9BACT|nr:response regulator [Cytophagaceae bacterium SJW1-29]
MAYISKKVRRWVSYGGISLGMLLILVSLFFAYQSLEDLSTQNLWVSNTISVVNQTSQFELLAKDIQSNVRGYLITGNENIMSDIRQSRQGLVSISDTLFNLLENDREQKARVIQMLSLSSEITGFSQAVVDTFRLRGLGPASDMIRGGRGIWLFEQLRNKINEIEAYANIEMDARRKQAHDTRQQALFYIVFTGITGFGITLLALISLMRDRRRQRVLKQEIIRKERLLNQYLEAIPDGIIVVNPAMDVTFINAAGRNMLGLEEKNEVPNLQALLNTVPLYRPENGEEPFTSENLPVRQGLQGRKSTGNRIDIVRDDQKIQVETSVEPIYELDGKIVGAISVFRDITERETYALNLKNARDLAEQSVRTRDVFLSNVSHEIRTPLNAILGFTDWLQREAHNETTREYVGYIQVASRNLLELINDLLDISKIEANQIVLDIAPTSIGELIDSVGILVKQKATEKGIEYRQELSPDLPRIIITDKLRLTQILLNLCGNAIKFTEQGYVRVQVKALGPVQNDKQRVQFVIEDTGIGIPQDRQEQIFDRFVQAAERTTSQFGGTGLGLSISRTLVTLLGGTLRLESEFGKGTVFTLEFDFATQENMASAEPPDLSVSAPEYLATLSILAAEDNLLNQKLLFAIFSRVGARLTIVENGQEALDVLERETFDLIIMDVQMPVMDGYTAIRKIRNTLRLSTPIITMTAHAMVGEKEEGARIGANSYISKPFKEKELFNEIIRVTQKPGPPVQRPPAVLVDTTYLQDITAGDRELRDELVELFAQDKEQQYAVIHEALEKADYDGVRKAIHALRSSLISVALLSSANQYKELERTLQSGSVPENLAQRLTELGEELERGLVELKALG